MDDSGDHLYHSLPNTSFRYIDQEQTLTLDDEDAISQRGRAPTPEPHRTSPRPQRRENQSDFQDEIHPPSLFDGSAIPPAPSQLEVSRFSSSRFPAFQQNSRSFYAVGNPLAGPRIATHQTPATQPIILPVSQIAAQPMNQQFMLQQPRPVPLAPPQAFMPPPMQPYHGPVPQSIGQSMLSFNDSASKLVKSPEKKDTLDRDGVMDKGVSKGCLVAGYVLVLVLLIAAACAAIALQLL